MTLAPGAYYPSLFLSTPQINLLPQSVFQNTSYVYADWLPWRRQIPVKGSLHLEASVECRALLGQEGSKGGQPTNRERLPEDEMGAHTWRGGLGFIRFIQEQCYDITEFGEKSGNLSHLHLSSQATSVGEYSPLNFEALLENRLANLK